MAIKVQQRYALPEEGYVRLQQVLAVFPVSRSTFLAGVKSGRFPKPIKLGIRTTAWKVEDIRALLAGVSRADTEPANKQRGAVKPSPIDLAGQG